MKRARLVAPAGLAAGAMASVLVISGCRLMTAAGGTVVREIALAATPHTVLVVVADQDSALALATTRRLIMASARNGERVMILGDRGGALLVASTAPPPPDIQVPGPPPPLPADPTSFQRSRYARSVRHYRGVVRSAWAALRRRQQEQLALWARSVIAQLDAHLQTGRGTGTSGTGGDDLGAALGAAAADISSLREAGLSDTQSKVIAIVGVGPGWAQPGLPAALRGSTVVVSDFPGSSDDEAEWQAGLMQDGAGRAVLLTPATGDQLLTVVRQGLDGAVTDTLSSVLFAPGQARLRAAAMPELHRLLNLLLVTYPHATASIDGYTDDLPMHSPGGNAYLSLRRAEVCEAWLIAHGVAASRLQAAGYGDADPVAPNTAHGQPLNRRVVVIIDPAG